MRLCIIQIVTFVFEAKIYETCRLLLPLLQQECVNLEGINLWTVKNWNGTDCIYNGEETIKFKIAIIVWSTGKGLSAFGLFLNKSM